MHKHREDNRQAVGRFELTGGASIAAASETTYKMTHSDKIELPNIVGW